MGARPTRKKTRIAERRENLVVSLSVSFIARAPRFDPHQKRTRWSLSNSLSTPIQNGRRIQIQMLQFVRARIGNTNRISTRHHQAKNNNNNKRRRTREKRDEIENAPSHDGVAREDCVFFVARIREFKREEEEEEEKTPMDITEKKKRPPPKRKANSLKIITCMRYFYLPTISYVDSS